MILQHFSRLFDLILIVVERKRLIVNLNEEHDIRDDIVVDIPLTERFRSSTER